MTPFRRRHVPLQATACSDAQWRESSSVLPRGAATGDFEIGVRHKGVIGRQLGKRRWEWLVEGERVKAKENFVVGRRVH